VQVNPYLFRFPGGTILQLALAASVGSHMRYSWRYAGISCLSAATTSYSRALSLAPRAAANSGALCLVQLRRPPLS